MGDELFDQNAAETTEIIGEVSDAVTEITELGEAPVEAPAETPVFETPAYEAPAYEAPVYESPVVPDFAPAPVETGNILNAGAEVLREIKARVLELDELKVRVSDLPKSSSSSIRRSVRSRRLWIPRSLRLLRSVVPRLRRALTRPSIRHAAA